MRFAHPAQPDRSVRLAYCLNLHAADTLDGLLEGLAGVTLPLRERLGARGPFGVGMYVGGRLATELDDDANGRARLAGYLRSHALEPFTWNAFPFAGFQTDGLKERVFEPTWFETQRSAYTRRIVRLAVEMMGDANPGGHVSVSTHTGAHATHLLARRGDPTLRTRLSEAFQAEQENLAGLEAASGRRVVLALEPEPRSTCNDLAMLARWRDAQTPGRAPSGRHLGTCLDTCHAAVEFEEPEEALARATAHGAPLGKLQFTSALELADPAADAAGRAALFALDEPRYLHQVTGRRAPRPDGDPQRDLVRAGDLPELSQAWSRGSADWRGCDAWRCHFHVPVDLTALGRLGTTRAHADACLAAALARPESWGTRDLHVEIETYTWSVLPSASFPRADDLIDGLEREYRHVLERLASAGWQPA